jgi:hypothetical protein
MCRRSFAFRIFSLENSLCNTPRPCARGLVYWQSGVISNPRQNRSFRDYEPCPTVRPPSAAKQPALARKIRKASCEKLDQDARSEGVCYPTSAVPLVSTKLDQKGAAPGARSTADATSPEDAKAAVALLVRAALGRG